MAEIVALRRDFAAAHHEQPALQGAALDEGVARRRKIAHGVVVARDGELDAFRGDRDHARRVGDVRVRARRLVQVEIRRNAAGRFDEPRKATLATFDAARGQTYVEAQQIALDAGSGHHAIAPRWERAAEQTATAVGEAIGAAFVAVVAKVGIGRAGEAPEGELAGERTAAFVGDHDLEQGAAGGALRLGNGPVGKRASNHALRARHREGPVPHRKLANQPGLSRLKADLHAPARRKQYQVTARALAPDLERGPGVRRARALSVYEVVAIAPTHALPDGQRLQRGAPQVFDARADVEQRLVVTQRVARGHAQACAGERQLFAALELAVA
jgi:hypothetical protein